MSWLSSFDPHAQGGGEGSQGAGGLYNRSNGADASGSRSGQPWQGTAPPGPSSAWDSSQAPRNPAFIPRRYPDRRRAPPQPVAPRPPPTHAVVREEDLQSGESKQAEVRKRRPPGWSEAPPAILVTKQTVPSKPSTLGKRKAAEPPSGPKNSKPAALPPRPPAHKTAPPPPTAPRSMREAGSSGPSSTSHTSSPTTPSFKPDPNQRYFSSIPTADLFSLDPRVIRRIMALAPPNTLCSTKAQRTKMQIMDPVFCDKQRQLQSASARNFLLEEHKARTTEEKKGKGTPTSSSPAQKDGKKKGAKGTSSSQSSEAGEKRRRLAAPSSEEAGSSSKQMSSKGSAASEPVHAKSSAQPAPSSPSPSARPVPAGRAQPSLLKPPELARHEPQPSASNLVASSSAREDAASGRAEETAEARRRAASPPGPPPRPPPGFVAAFPPKEQLQQQVMPAAEEVARAGEEVAPAAEGEESMDMSLSEAEREKTPAAEHKVVVAPPPVAAPAPAPSPAPAPARRRFIEVSPEPQDSDQSDEMQGAPEPAEESFATPPLRPGSHARTLPPPPQPAESAIPSRWDKGKSRLFDDDEDDEVQAPQARANGSHAAGSHFRRPERAAFEELFEPSEARDELGGPRFPRALNANGTHSTPGEHLQQGISAALAMAWQRSCLTMMDTSSSGGDESDLDDGSAYSAQAGAGTLTSVGSGPQEIKAEPDEEVESSQRRAESARPRSRASSVNSDASDVPLARARPRTTQSAGPDGSQRRGRGAGSFQAPSAGRQGTIHEASDGYDYDSDEPLARRHAGGSRETRSMSANASVRKPRPKFKVSIQNEGTHALGIRASYLCPIETESGQRGLLSTSKHGRMALVSPLTRVRDPDTNVPPHPILTTGKVSATNVTDAVRLSTKVVGVACRSNVAVGPRLSQMALVFAMDGSGGSNGKKGSPGSALDVMELRPTPHLGGVSALSPLSGSSSEVSFITGGMDGVVERWTSGERRTTTTQIHCLHDREVTAVAAMRRHNLVVSSTEGKVLGFDFEHLRTVFSWITTDRISALQHTHHVDVVAGTVLRTDFDQVKFWDVRQDARDIPRPVLRAGWAAATAPSHLGRVTFHPTKPSLFAIGSDDGKLRLFDVRKLNSVLLLEVGLGESVVAGAHWEDGETLSALETQRLHRFGAAFEDVEE